MARREESGAGASGMRYMDRDFDGSARPPFYLDEHFHQRYLETGELVTSETVATVPGRVEDALALVNGPWTWWDFGRVTQYRELERGGSEQVLAPVWWFITRVRLHIYPAQELHDAEGVRIPIRLSRHFNGAATFDIWKSGPGQIRLRGRFHGVEAHVPFTPPQVACRMHLRAEAGRMPFPFRTNGGWRGLVRELRDRAGAG